MGHPWVKSQAAGGEGPVVALPRLCWIAVVSVWFFVCCLLDLTVALCCPLPLALSRQSLRKQQTHAACMQPDINVADNAWKRSFDLALGQPATVCRQRLLRDCGQRAAGSGHQQGKRSAQHALQQLKA